MHILYRYPFCKVKYIVHIHKLMALNEKGHREQKNSKNAMLNTNQEMRQLQMIACHFIKKWSSSDESQEPNFTKIWKWYDTMALVLVVVVFAVVEFGSYENWFVFSSGSFQFLTSLTSIPNLWIDIRLFEIQYFTMYQF